MAGLRLPILVALLQASVCSAALEIKYYQTGTNCATTSVVFPSLMLPNVTPSTTATQCVSYDDAQPAVPSTWNLAGKRFTFEYINATHFRTQYPCDNAACTTCTHNQVVASGACTANMISGGEPFIISPSWISPTTIAPGQAPQTSSAINAKTSVFVSLALLLACRWLDAH